LISVAQVVVVGTIYASRVVIPQNGTLHDLSVFIGTSSGNLRLGIYDTGTALAANRTLLFDSGSVASAANWKSVDPGLAVTAGQQLDFAVIADNTTITFGRCANLAAAQFQLPTGYLAGGGDLPKVGWTDATGSFTAFPTPLAEASSTAGGGVCMIARVV
jgi:hypothetical protein